MSRPAQNSSAASTDSSYFEQQRGILLGQIGESMEQVLQNLNKLNRSLEGMTAVGNEFSAVEALWSHFENVMAKEPDAAEDDKNQSTQDTQQTPSKSSPTAGR